MTTPRAAVAAAIRLARLERLDESLSDDAVERNLRQQIAVQRQLNALQRQRIQLLQEDADAVKAQRTTVQQAATRSARSSLSELSARVMVLRDKIAAERQLRQLRFQCLQEYGGVYAAKYGLHVTGDDFQALLQDLGRQERPS